MFAFRHVEYAHDLWWQFAFSGDAPRSLRAMVGALSVILFFALAKLLSPAVRKPQLPGRDELEKAKLIIEKSTGTIGYLAFLEDKALLFNDREKRLHHVWRREEELDRHGGSYWTCFRT